MYHNYNKIPYIEIIGVYFKCKSIFLKNKMMVRTTKLSVVAGKPPRADTIWV